MVAVAVTASVRSIPCCHDHSAPAVSIDAPVEACRYHADLVIIEDGTAACNAKLHPDLVQRLLGAFWQIDCVLLS